MAKGRKLHEMLQEKQEPFYLDIYLIEKGYSTRVLENQEKITLCWPVNARKSIQRLTKDDFTRKRSGGFRGILSKILYWKLSKKTLKCENIKSLDNGMTNVEIFSDSICFEEESETKKQSPVSVFDFHSSPVHNKEDISKSPSFVNSPRKALNIFKELLQLASINDISNSNDLDDWSSNSDASSFSSDDLSKDCLIFSLERESSEAFVKERVVSDFLQSTKHWVYFNCEMSKEIGLEIESAIFEEIKEELVLDILVFRL